MLGEYYLVQFVSICILAKKYKKIYCIIVIFGLEISVIVRLRFYKPALIYILVLFFSLFKNIHNRKLTLFGLMFINQGHKPSEMLRLAMPV